MDENESLILIRPNCIMTAQTDPNNYSDHDYDDGDNHAAGLRPDRVLLHCLHPGRGGSEHWQGGAAAPGHKEYQYVHSEP